MTDIPTKPTPPTPTPAAIPASVLAETDMLAVANVLGVEPTLPPNTGDVK